MLKNLFKSPIEAAKNKVSEYVNLKVEEAKLTTIEKATPIAASITIGIIIIALAFMFFLFIGMALAWYFSNLFDSTALGYLTVAGIFLIFIILIAVLFGKLVKSIANILAKKLTEIL